jgi:transcriptional regulator with PAS, ATPase and Fis domain
MAETRRSTSCLQDPSLGPAEAAVSSHGLRPLVGRDSEISVGELEDLISVLALIMENVYSGVIVCDQDCRILYINKFYAALLKTEKEKAVGKHIKEFFPASRVPVVLESGESELKRKCSLRADLDLLINRIPLKRHGQTIGVVLQTTFKNFTEINDLMARLDLLEKEVNYYKRGLDSFLSATCTFDSIIGVSRRISEAKRTAEKYAKTDASVLILGATGTGKELFAHAVHMASFRRNGPFVCVNCAAIPKELLESELFGYESGAFTGARRRGKAGKIELAQRGTLFLDEIGDIPLNAQAKLLRVLENGEVEKVGGLKRVKVDFRLVAATNRDLKDMLARGQFREDLFYRLNTMTVEVPPLSERVEDIRNLIRHFLASRGKPTLHVTEDAMRTLECYPWPGNVRELENAVERAISLAEGESIDVEHLPHQITNFNHGRGGVTTSSAVRTLSMALARHEKQILSQALDSTKGNMSRAAKILGIARSTLYEKCKQHDLRVSR